MLADVETGALAACINTEILQELLYHYNYINRAEEGVKLCREIMKYPLTILSIRQADISLAIDIFDHHRATGLQPRDAIHAATMRNQGSAI